MCGIVGIYSPAGAVSPEDLERATGVLTHRGPDGQRTWLAADHRVGLGHARLSIIDLATGDQPIASEDGRRHIVVNGEFYDFERIQQDLCRRDHPFTTPPAALSTDGRLYQLIQDTLRGPALESLPFFDRSRVVALLDQLPAIDDGLRTAYDMPLMVLLSASVIHERIISPGSSA
jgi:glutamine phosphoribosylpyrophosphate amidotransferase